MNVFGGYVDGGMLTRDNRVKGPTMFRDCARRTWCCRRATFLHAIAVKTVSHQVLDEFHFHGSWRHATPHTHGGLHVNRAKSAYWCATEVSFGKTSTRDPLPPSLTHRCPLGWGQHWGGCGAPEGGWTRAGPRWDVSASQSGTLDLIVKHRKREKSETHSVLLTTSTLLLVRMIGRFWYIRCCCST